MSKFKAAITVSISVSTVSPKELERAECEFLNGNFEQAEQIIVELLQRGASKVDQAAVYHLKILLPIS